MTKAIVHIDGDAFFASCEVSLNPYLKGKPVITGKERGIAAALTYEAKALGVKRGMTISEIRKLCPQAIILPSDYETYSLISQKMFNIVRRYTPYVEEYSIDECFADITGVDTVCGLSYLEIASAIKTDLQRELGMTFSVGLAPNKVLAKVASKWKKPDGLTHIPIQDISLFENQLPIDKIWGIGPQTAIFLQKKGVITALDFANKSKEWVFENLSKPYIEIWHELHGYYVYQLNTEVKLLYQSISKTKTFTPATSDIQFILSQLSKNVENACIKARRYHLITKEISFFIKTKDFRYLGQTIRLNQATSLPIDIISAIKDKLALVYDPHQKYRASGVRLSALTVDNFPQRDLFGAFVRSDSLNKVFQAVDTMAHKFGKYTIFLGSSLSALKSTQHQGDRGDKPWRQKLIIKGEMGRRHLPLPIMGEVS